MPTSGVIRLTFVSFLPSSPFLTFHRRPISGSIVVPLSSLVEVTVVAVEDMGLLFEGIFEEADAVEEYDDNVLALSQIPLRASRKLSLCHWINCVRELEDTPPRR